EDTENSGSASSLDVGGIAEYIRLKRYSSGSGSSVASASKPYGSDHSRTTASTVSTTMNNSSLSTFLGAAGQDSFGSLETSGNTSRPSLQLVKEESPNSILELNSSSSSDGSAQEKKNTAVMEAAAIDHHCFVLDDDNDDDGGHGGASSGDSGDIS
ncbi:MAG: hypothetical protein SGILL_004333, partial [Bacillariaceae sp.]